MGYYRAHIQYEQLKSLYGKGDELSQYLIRGITQNAYTYGPTAYMRIAREKVERLRKNTFEYLDRQKEPYKAIYSCIWFTGWGVEKLEPGTGINEVTHFISHQYAMRNLYDTNT